MEGLAPRLTATTVVWAIRSLAAIAFAFPVTLRFVEAGILPIQFLAITGAAVLLGFPIQLVAVIYHWFSASRWIALLFFGIHIVAVWTSIPRMVV